MIVHTGMEHAGRKKLLHTKRNTGLMCFVLKVIIYGFKHFIS
jgi:hypothetical protein